MDESFFLTKSFTELTEEAKEKAFKNHFFAIQNDILQKKEKTTLEKRVEFTVKGIGFYIDYLTLDEYFSGEGRILTVMCSWEKKNKQSTAGMLDWLGKEKNPFGDFISQFHISYFVDEDRFEYFVTPYDTSEGKMTFEESKSFLELVGNEGFDKDAKKKINEYRFKNAFKNYQVDLEDLDILLTLKMRKNSAFNNLLKQKIFETVEKYEKIHNSAEEKEKMKKELEKGRMDYFNVNGYYFARNL